MRERRNRIWVSVNLTPGYGRVATLALLSEMVAQNTTRIPGPRSHPMGRRFVGVMNNNPFPMSMSRARSRNPGLHPSGETPLHLPNPWPQCLCHCSCPLEDIPPNPNLSSSESEYSTSSPPSLESITGPESGYEASYSA